MVILSPHGDHGFDALAQQLKAQGHEWAGARKKIRKSASEKKKESEARIQRLTESKVTEALLARLDDFKLDGHVDWLGDALLDSARSDSLRRVCQAFGLKREKEVQTTYGKQRETWRDRLCRAVLEKEVKSRPLFLAALMQEQGWTYRPNKESPSLRERLIEEVKLDGKKIEQGVRESRAASTIGARPN